MNTYIPIPNFPGYFITRDGRVLSQRPYKRWKKHGRLAGYASVTLYRNGQRYDCYIHRLLLETFVGPCPSGMECRHLDGDKQNYSLNNLQWGTSSENKQDTIAHGTFRGGGPKGERQGSSKLTNKQAAEVRHLRAGGMAVKDLAVRFRVSVVAIYNVIRYKTYLEV